MSVSKERVDTTKEKTISDFIPYRSMLDLNTVKTADCSYVRVIKLQGVSFESADDYKINNWSDQLNAVLKSIGSPEVAVWTHIVRRRTSLFPRGEFKAGSFAESFNVKYRKTMVKEKLYINELYLSIIFREVEEGKISSIADTIKNIISKKTKEDILFNQKKALDKFNQITSTVIDSLEDYNPTLLGAYHLKKISRLNNGNEEVYYSEQHIENIDDVDSKTIVYSEVLEFFSYLLNNNIDRVQLPLGEVHKYIPNTRIFFRDDSGIMIENNQNDIFGSMVGITSYQDHTNPVMLAEMLDVDFEFILSQSLTFINKVDAMNKIKMQFDRMEATEDVGFTQQESLLGAMDDLQSNRFEMGNYSFALFVKANETSRLRDNIARAGSILMNNGLKWVVEDRASMASYISMLPANFSYRPRIALITTLNFAGLSPLHGFPTGRYTDNQWGDAVTMFKTLADSPYYFNFHAPDMLETDFNEDLEHEIVIESASESEEFELANTVVMGQSGAGKTVLQGVLLAQCQKFNTPENPATFICTDSERGMSISIKAMGGIYFDISPDNRDQTFNPFLLPYSTSNVTFLVNLVKTLVEDQYYKITPTTEDLLATEISSILKMDNPKVKRLNQLRTYLDKSEKDGIYMRLEKWCEGGIHGWIFDNEKDTFDLKKQSIMCFEMSRFLNDDEIRPAISMYFFHRLEELLTNKERLIIFLDEFWQILSDEYFEKRIFGLLKRIRKQNGFLVMFTQEPEDFLKSAISSTLRQQTATQIFLPNEEGDRESYKKMGVSDAEFELIKSLQKRSRRFLIRQGGGSILAELNLKGFNHELGVFSATTKTMAVVDKLEEKYGSNPDIWLPKFYDFLDGKLDVFKGE